MFLNFLDKNYLNFRKLSNFYRKFKNNNEYICEIFEKIRNLDELEEIWVKYSEY